MPSNAIRNKDRGAGKDFRAFKVKAAYKINRGQHEQETDVARGHCPERGDSSARLQPWWVCPLAGQRLHSPEEAARHAGV